MSSSAQASFPFAIPTASAERALRQAPARNPIHVTLHSSDARWNLHAPSAEAALRAAVAATRPLVGFHVFHVSVRGDDVHLLVEAASSAALSSGIAIFAAAGSRALNRAAARLGPVFEPGFEARELRTSAEFRSALRLLIGPDRRERAS
jgi:hypothetical protein